MTLRLNRKRAWGRWHLTVPPTSLVFDTRESGHYEIPLAELATAEAAQLRIETVVALKTAWVDQRVIDDLRRAIRELTASGTLGR